MRKIIFCVIVVCLAFSSGAMANGLYREYLAHETNCAVVVNSEKQDYDCPIVTINDRTYVAARDVFEKLGYSVDWNENENMIVVTNSIELPYYENIEKHSEGTTRNNVKYKYTYAEDFSYKDYAKKLGLTQVNARYGEVPNVQMATEIAGVLFGNSANQGSGRIMSVYYDKTEDAWVVIEENDVVGHSGFKTVVIRRSDGTILNKYEFR